MTKKLGLLFLGFTLITFFSLISCRKPCRGPFPNKLKVTGLDWHNYEATYSGSDLSLQNILADSVYYNMYSINISPRLEPYIGQNLNHNSFSLISSAYACSPVLPEYTDEKIDSIVIKSVKDFNINHPEGADLSDLFDIIIRNNEIGIYEKHNLNDYVKTNPSAPNNFTLILREQPDATTDFEFLVQYYQKGIDHNFFEFTTEKIVIVKE